MLSSMHLARGARRVALTPTCERERPHRNSKQQRPQFSSKTQAAKFQSMVSKTRISNLTALWCEYDHEPIAAVAVHAERSNSAHHGTVDPDEGHFTDSAPAIRSSAIR